MDHSGLKDKDRVRGSNAQIGGVDTEIMVELEEGTRLVANVIGIEPHDIEIGMPVAVEFVDHDDELTLPAFRPVGG